MYAPSCKLLLFRKFHYCSCFSSFPPIQGVQSGGIVWKVSNKDKLSSVTDADEQLNFHATEPGEYTIRAEVAGTSYSSQWESVQFWCKPRCLYFE